MHSRKKGKAGSKKPKVDIIKPWLTYTKEEVEQLVIKLHKTGKNAAVIGIILRDSYGIPSIKAITNKSISKVLKDHKLTSEIPEDLMQLIKKEINLNKHLAKYKKDMFAKRGLLLTESKIRRLTKYYKRNSVLPASWVYNREQIKLV